MLVNRRDMLRVGGWVGMGFAAQSAGLNLAWAQDNPRGPIGLGLCIGLNAVDPASYGGWSGPLAGCVPDANDMSRLLRRQGFLVRTLWDRRTATGYSKPDDVGTKANVRKWIERAASGLRAGDIFVITYSGHGSQATDTNQDDADGKDETWCLLDGEVIDDVRADLWSKFVAGVRIVVVSDSCHSATMARVAEYERSIIDDAGEAAASRAATRGASAPADARGAARSNMQERLAALRRTRDAGEVESEVPSPVRQMPERVRELLDSNVDYTDELKRSQDGISASRAALRNAVARIHAFGACQDNQTASDGTGNGLFTSRLLSVWNQGQAANYAQFYAAIKRLMPYYQVPNLDSFGAPNAAFDGQKPFTI